MEMLPDWLWHLGTALVDPAMRIEHILGSVCYRCLPPPAVGMDIGRSHEPAVQVQPPKCFSPCSPSRFRTRHWFLNQACLGYFLHHAIMVASRRRLRLCHWLARFHP